MRNKLTCAFPTCLSKLLLLLVYECYLTAMLLIRKTNHTYKETQQETCCRLGQITFYSWILGPTTLLEGETLPMGTGRG